MVRPSAVSCPVVGVPGVGLSSSVSLSRPQTPRCCVLSHHVVSVRRLSSGFRRVGDSQAMSMARECACSILMITAAKDRLVDCAEVLASDMGGNKASVRTAMHQEVQNKRVAKQQLVDKVSEFPCAQNSYFSCCRSTHKCLRASHRSAALQHPGLRWWPARGK